MVSILGVPRKKKRALHRCRGQNKNVKVLILDFAICFAIALIAVIAVGYFEAFSWYIGKIEFTLSYHA